MVSCWLLGIASLALAMIPTGQTYGRYTAVTVNKSATHTTLSGSTAFVVTPVPVNLGTFTAGASINLTQVISITNNAKKAVDLQVTFIQTGTATLNVTVGVSATNLAQKQKATVSLTGTVGPTAGTIVGYFHITGLNGFLSLDVPVSGTVTAPSQPQSVPAAAAPLRPSPSPTPAMRPTQPGKPIQRTSRTAEPTPVLPPFNRPITNSGGSETQ